MTPEERGALTASALRGSWRAVPAPSTLTLAQLEVLTDHFLATGASGLGWRVIRGQPTLAAAPAGRRLQDGQRLHALQAALHERRLGAVLDLCAAQGIDPLLVKGWTVARRYPERGSRP